MGWLFRVAYWCVVVALALIGARLAVGGTSNQSWREVIVPWLQYVGLPLVFLITAAVMATIPITKWVLDRRYARDLQRQVRANLTPGSFREVDAAAALHYLLHESVWGWRQYAKLNSWGWVDGLHLAEFQRAALRGDIVTVGRSSRDGRVVVIERRVWTHGRIDRKTAAQAGGVIMENRVIGTMSTYAQLAMAEADLLQAWPKASVVRRWRSTAWVWLKIRIWYGSRLSNWLDARRRSNKPDRTFT